MGPKPLTVLNFPPLRYARLGKGGRMAIFVLPLVLMSLVVAVLYGCWWIFPLILGVGLVITAGYYSWRWAGRIGGAPGGFRTWWNANRERLAWAMSIFVSITLTAILIWCLVQRFAPNCTGGCLSHLAGAVSAIAPAAATYPEPIAVVLKPGEPFAIRVEADYGVHGWTDTDIVREEWRQRGSAKVLVLTATKKTEIRYRVFRCATETPCTGPSPYSLR